MMDTRQALLMARKLCAIASDNNKPKGYIENLIARIRTQNTVICYISQQDLSYTAIVNGQKAKVFI